jgi:hypothetical protein
VTSGVRKAKRIPVSGSAPVGKARPPRLPKLTANEKEYADAVALAWESIPYGVLQDQWLRPNDGNTILRGVVNAFEPYQEFLNELTLFQLNQSGALMFNEIKRDVAADWKTLEKATPSQTALAMKFDRASPMATSYASMSAANMVTDMIDSQIQSVRSVITRAFNDGLTRQQTSRNLIQILNEIPTPRGATAGNYALGQMFGNATKGLTVRYADAVVNRAARLARQNPDISHVDLKRKVDQYGAKLRRSRARTIARTELMRASNQGRLEGMWQAADRGLVDPTLAKKQWVTSSFDVCPICVPLNGVTVGIRDSFGPPGQAPPAHPNCRCTVRMLPDPMTFGLPTSTGTGMTGSPMQLIRPTRPGLKIQDLDEAAGVVGPAAPLVGEPGAPPIIGDDVVPDVADLPPLTPNDFPNWMPAEDLANYGVRTRAWSDAASPLHWEQKVKPEKLRMAKKPKESGDMHAGLFDDIEAAGEIRRPVDVLVHTDGTFEIRGGHHRIIIAEELNIPVPVRWYGPEYKNVTGQSASITREQFKLMGGSRPTAAQPGKSFAEVMGGPPAMPSRVRPVGAETIQPTMTRTGNVSAGFDVPTSGIAQETVGVVLQGMDEAGYVLPNTLPTGNVRVQILNKAKGRKAAQRGSFNVLKKKTKPRFPGAGASEQKMQEYRDKIMEWNANPGESLLVVRKGQGLTRGSMQNTAAHEIGHRLDKIVKADIGDNPISPYIGLEGNYSDKTMEAVGRVIRRRSNDVSADEAFQRLTFSQLYDDEASEAMLNFFQAAGRSNALAEIRNMAVGTGNTAFGRYATTPTEIWARAFNQYFTMKHGSAEAIEDMLLKASKPLWSEAADSAKHLEDFWYGYQWRQDEFEELIAPHVEKVLKHLGVIE